MSSLILVKSVSRTSLIAACVLAGSWQLHAQGTTNVDCSDPRLSTSSLCQQQIANQVAAPAASAAPDANRGQRQSDTVSTPLYVDASGNHFDRTTAATDRNQYTFTPDPITDFQKLAQASTSDLLPVFGRDLFERAPSTFAPADEIPVTPDYVIGPGDEVLLRLWGPEAASTNSQLTVDSSGNIYVPRVGSVQVSGLRLQELQDRISSEVNRNFRNYNIAVSLGHLRSIQIYVVGEARRPGAYTISGLSTVLNALFASGGPNVQGSMRRIQVRRGNQIRTELDLYDLILRGDKSKDVRLESGDTIFIPSVGPQVALGGSVRHPAIYELREASSGESTTTLNDLLMLAGGLTATAATNQIHLERIDSDRQRHAVTVALDSSGLAMRLKDGDVLYTGHISSGFQNTVTIRGNLANPGRFSWHPGMHLSDILPDRAALLTNDYWRERNRLGIPTPLFEPAEIPAQTSRSAADLTSNNRATSRDALAAVQPANNAGNQQGVSLAAGGVVSNGTAALDQAAQGEAGVQSGSAYVNRVRIPAPEIDWSYAVIERLDPNTLKSSLVPFNLGRLLQDHDATQNLELQPGDVVTILSQRDILVPQQEQTKYVRLEGEFVGAGVYSVRPGETLDQLVMRAGGFTPDAYLYGSSFQRESARVFQQQRLDEYITRLSTDMERALAVRGANGAYDPNAITLERNIVTQLRDLRATGRVVLEFTSNSRDIGAVPHLPLENGDIFQVPARPNTISVIGAVYGQNVFLYNPDRHLRDYLSLAGNANRIADKSHAFIIRADGSVFSRERAKGVLSNHFDSSVINPGDSIIIPEKLIKPSALRTILEYSQSLSSFGLSAAALAVLLQ